MKLSNRQRSKSAKIELSMTSMIDVVFLLLIFFLVTTTFVAPERQLKTNVKTQQQSAKPKSDLEPAVIDIKMADGIASYHMGAIVTQDIIELDQVLRSFQNKLDGAYIRAADDVSFEMPVLAINACKNAGFPNVTYIPLNDGTEQP